MAEHREVSRGGGSRAASVLPGPPAEFVGYEQTEVLTAIVALNDLGDGTFEAKLERSPFYPAGGGQVSDQGWIEHDETGARAELREAVRLGDDQTLVFEGEGFAAGDRVKAVVPWAVRFPTMANHTATHLLHESLRRVLGEHVQQAGSAVRPDKLRFDFTHEQALTSDERAQVEELVNEQIFAARPVRTSIQSFYPPGVGARDLRECLLIQLRRDGKGSSLEYKIISEHMQDLGKRRFPEIARRLGTSAEQSRRARISLRAGSETRPDLRRGAEQLRPSGRDGRKNGRRLADQSERRADPASAHQQYLQGSDGAGGQGNEVQDYIREKIRSGKFLIKSIHQRQQTISNIAHQIVSRQRDFFEHGPAQAEADDHGANRREVGVHETTVSRAISGKYMATPMACSK